MVVRCRLHERTAAVGGTPHFGAGRDQIPYEFRIAFRGRDEQRGLVLMPGIHIGAGGDQGARNLRMAVHRRSQQGSIAVAHLGVDVGLGGDQGFHYLQMAVPRRLRQGLGVLGRTPQIGPGRDQRLHNPGVAVRRRPQQGRHAIRQAVVHIGLRVDQRPHDPGMAVRCRREQRRLAIETLRVHVGPGRDQGSGYVQVAAGRSYEQGRVAVEAPGMHIGASGKQGLHRPHAAAGRGCEQGRLAVILLCIHAGVRGKQGLHGLPFAVARCLQQRRGGGSGNVRRAVHMGIAVGGVAVRGRLFFVRGVSVPRGGHSDCSRGLSGFVPPRARCKMMAGQSQTKYPTQANAKSGPVLYNLSVHKGLIEGGEAVRDREGSGAAQSYAAAAPRGPRADGHQSIQAETIKPRMPRVSAGGGRRRTGCAAPRGILRPCAGRYRCPRH